MKIDECGLLKCGFAKPHNSWLGREVLFQTGEPLGLRELEMLECEIDEIQQLMTEPDDDPG